MKQTNNFTSRKTAMLTILIMLLICGAQAAFAQTSAFTYQGRFTDSSAAQPTNGTYTMTFRLYDQATGGNQIPDSSTAETSTVSVVNGIFTTRLNFGAQAFNPALTASSARYLEIQVGSTVLTPRQEITSAPFTIRAREATTADGLSANCVSCVTNVQINSVDGAKITGSVANAINATNAASATTAQNADNLGGVAASNFVQSNSNAFVRNQTTPQTANLNITGAASVGGNVGIGTTATTNEALRVVGGNVGNTVAGESISLQAGNGSVNNNTYGGGGSITLQPGTGTVGPSASAPNGNVLLAPNTGNVGIGTTNPTSKLTVNGDLTVNGTINGTINSLGQDARMVYGTNPLTVVPGNPSFTLVPGLTQTINVPANTFPEIVISTDGGIQTNSQTSDGKSIVEVAIYVDGSEISARRYQLSNAAGIVPAIVNWALSGEQLLAPGSHTVEVRARSTSNGFESPATVSSGNSILRGQLTVTTIKR